MKIIFRADGSHQRGMGHIYRCCVIAKKFVGWDIGFISRPDEFAFKKIKEEGFSVVSSKSEKEDFSALEKQKPDVIVVDLLNTKDDYMRKLKSSCKCLVTIDDEGKGNVHADFVFNLLYNIHTQEDGKRVFTSPKYSILNEEYETSASKEKPVRKVVKRILVTQGGSNTAGHMASILLALNSMSFENGVQIDVIIGSAFKNVGELESIKRMCSHKMVFHYSPPSLFRLVWDADIAVSAGGITPFEIASTGTPLIVVCQNSMEVETAQRLMENNAAITLGDTFINEAFIHLLQELMLDYDRRRRMSDAQRSYVGAFGAAKIKELVTAKLGG